MFAARGLQADSNKGRARRQAFRMTRSSSTLEGLTPRRNIPAEWVYY